jgi:hypothetical protein
MATRSTKHANGAAKRRTTAKHQSAAPLRTDAAIIRAAVIYAQCISAYHGGFRGDPSGDNDTAASIGSRYFDQAKQQLDLLAESPATSIEALDAKARVVPIMLEDSCNSCGEDFEIAFLRCFVNDVRTFLASLVRDDKGEVTGIYRRIHSASDAVAASRGAGAAS